MFRFTENELLHLSNLESDCLQEFLNMKVTTAEEKKIIQDSMAFAKKEAQTDEYRVENESLKPPVSSDSEYESEEDREDLENCKTSSSYIIGPEKNEIFKEDCFDDEESEIDLAEKTQIIEEFFKEEDEANQALSQEIKEENEDSDVSQKHEKEIDKILNEQKGSINF